MRLASFWFFVVIMGCGNATPEGTKAPTSTGSSADGGGGGVGSSPASATSPANATRTDGGSSSSSDGKAFAGTTGEATSLISAAVDKKQGEIAVCIREFRVRKKMARDRVAVSFGIDQDGRLLGVTSKGREDTELKACVQEALRGAPFPRSHAGVITVTKTYEELIQ